MPLSLTEKERKDDVSCWPLRDDKNLPVLGPSLNVYIY